MQRYPLHEELKELNYIKLPAITFLPFIINPFLYLSFRLTKIKKDVKETRIKIPSYHQGKVQLFIYEPKHESKKLPCLLYFHGGAFVIKASPHHKLLAMEYARQTPCKVIFVDYRLAPIHPFPYALEDSYAALQWVIAHQNELNIDPQRIVVVGDSAGGNLAAATTILAIERKTLTPCFQMLIYPVLDQKQETESMKQYLKTPMWNATLNRKMWLKYLPHPQENQRAMFSPVDASSLASLPPSYVEVAEFDCLHDEGINYAKKMQEAGVQVQIEDTKGTVHGYDALLSKNYVQTMVQKRIVALQKALYPNKEIL